MGQYEVAKLILESENGLTKDEIIRRIDLAKGSTENSIYDLLQKEYILRTEQDIYIWNPDRDKEDISKLKPFSLDELSF